MNHKHTFIISTEFLLGPPINRFAKREESCHLCHLTSVYYVFYFVLAKMPELDVYVKNVWMLMSSSRTSEVIIFELMMES